MNNTFILTEADFIGATAMDAKVDRCIEKKIKNGGKEFLTLAIISNVMSYIINGNYTTAAKLLLKSGAKGNLVAIIAQWHGGMDNVSIKYMVFGEINKKSDYLFYEGISNRIFIYFTLFLLLNSHEKT